MNILIMGMNYLPERTAGLYTTALSEFLVSGSHNVSVITAFPHYPEWKIQEGYKNKFFLQETINGVRVLRGYVHIPKNSGAYERVLYDCSLSISAFFSAWRVRDIDIILAISPPIQLGLCAWVLSLLKGAPFVLQIKDLPVDAAVALHMLKNRVVLRLARWMEDFTYRKAQRILVICQGFVDHLRARGVPESKILLLPDFVDTNFIRPSERNNSFRKVQELDEEQFLILYAGNMGAKQALENVIQAAASLQAERSFLFLLVGDGSGKKRLMEMAGRHQISNVRFLPVQSGDLLPEMLSSADILLINQHSEVVDMVLPSKLLTYMAAGRPIVAAVHSRSEAARYIMQAECGLIVPPENPQCLAEAIQQIRSNPDLARRLGQNARSFAEKHFEKKKILQRYEEFFLQLQTIPG